MTTAKTMQDNGTAPPAVGSRLDRRVRPPTKADIDRLGWLLRDWMREEQNLRSHYGEEVTPGSMRARRLKDADALGRALQYLMALRSPERPNVRVEPLAEGKSARTRGSASPVNEATDPKGTP